MSGIVSCTLGGLQRPDDGLFVQRRRHWRPGSVVTCMTPTVKPILPGLTGYVIKLVVKVTAPASVKSISDTATVTSSNTDTNQGRQHRDRDDESHAVERITTQRSRSARRI